MFWRLRSARPPRRFRLAFRQRRSVSIHTECVAGHAFGAPNCDCATRMRTSLERLALGERGVLIYISNTDRSFGTMTIPSQPGDAAASHLGRLAIRLARAL